MMFQKKVFTPFKLVTYFLYSIIVLFISNCTASNLQAREFDAYLASYSKNLTENRTDSIAFLLNEMYEENIVFFHFYLHEEKVVQTLIASNIDYLKTLNDLNPEIQAALKPQYYFAAAKTHQIETTVAINELSLLLKQNAQYNTKLERYLLLLLSDTALQKQLNFQQLLSQVSEALVNNLQQVDNCSRFETCYERGYYRYLLSELKYIQAGRVSNPSSKITFLKQAINFLPDDKDIKYDYVASTDKSFFRGKQNIADQVYQALENHLSPKSLLNELSNLALHQPNKKNMDLLKQSHKKVYPNNQFQPFWYNTIESMTKKSPNFQLITLTNEPVSLSAFDGKWVLVDFWGTWCVPCVQELPKIEELYQKIQTSPDLQQAFDIITIVSKDTPKKVLRFMEKKNYHFPVAMEDYDTTDLFNVNGFPSKFLITPNGNIIPIHYASKDWVNYLSNYTGLKLLSN